MKNGYFLLCLVVAFFQDETAEEATVPIGDMQTLIPLESEPELEIFPNFDEGEIDLTATQNDAENSLISRYHLISQKNIRLVKSNKHLQKKTLEIEMKILAYLKEAEKFREVSRKKLSQLAGQMDQAVEANKKVSQNKELNEEGAIKAQDLSFFIQAKQENNSTQAEVTLFDLTKPGVVIFNLTENEQGSRDESFSFIFVVFLMFCFLFLASFKKLSDGTLDSAFSQPFYKLLTGLCTFALINSSFVLIKDHLDNASIYFDQIFLACFLFAVIWFGLGVWLVVACQSFSVIWEHFEDQLCKGEVNPENKQFGIMRKLFVCNPFLPVFTERLLRPDFNFSEYLKRSLCETLSQVFSISPLCAVFISVLVLLWRIAVGCSTDFQFYSLFGSSFVFFGLSVVFDLKCWLICKKLIPDEGSDLKVIYDYSYKNDIETPTYLKSHIPGPNSDLNIFSIYSLKLTCSYIFKGVYPTRHELLFWFDSYGVKLMVSLFQFIMISLSLWLTLTIIYFSSIFSLTSGVIFLSVTNILNTLTVVWVLPQWLKYLSISSHLEMMKNDEIINAVVQLTQKLRMERNWRLLVQFSGLWQDSMVERSIEKLPKLNLHLKKLIKESFELTSCHWNVKYNELNDVLNRVGVQMDNDQFRVFLKDCELNDEDLISYKGVVKGVKRLLVGNTQVPRNVVSEVLKYYFDKEEVSLEEVSAFLQKNRWFMRDEDIHDFLVDLHFNLNSKGFVGVEDIEFSN